MDSLRSRQKDRIRCVKDLLREILVKDKERGTGKVGRAFRLSCGSDTCDGEEDGRTGRKSLTLQNSSEKDSAGRWLVLKLELPVEGIPRSSLCHLLEAATRSIRVDPEGQQLGL